MDDGENLEQQLQEIVGQLKETMLGRQKRIEELRKEISEIEASIIGWALLIILIGLACRIGVSVLVT